MARAAAQLGERRLDGGVAGPSEEVDEEGIFERIRRDRTGLELRQVDLMIGEQLQALEERPRVMVDGEGEARLLPLEAGGDVSLAHEGEEARDVQRRALYVVGENLQPVDLRAAFGGDRGLAGSLAALGDQLRRARGVVLGHRRQAASGVPGSRGTAPARWDGSGPSSRPRAGSRGGPEGSARSGNTPRPSRTPCAKAGGRCSRRRSPRCCSQRARSPGSRGPIPRRRRPAR